MIFQVEPEIKCFECRFSLLFSSKIIIKQFFVSCSVNIGEHLLHLRRIIVTYLFSKYWKGQMTVLIVVSMLFDILVVLFI